MDTSELGYGGILKQNIDNKDKIIRYYSCLWKPTQQKYFTSKKEMLNIVNCIDCKALKYILGKDVKNLVFEYIFVRWQTLLAIFYFYIEYIKGKSNSLSQI